MNLLSVSNVKNLLERYRVRPFKGFGQNFLVSREILNKIIAAADIDPKDIVLEIGPGIGTLTQELAKKSKKVVAVEKDGKMVEILKETLQEFKNTRVTRGDILKTGNLNLKNYKVVANLPYNITSPVIRKFLESKNPPRGMTLMIQKEVAKRICAKPPDMNLLAISVQFYSEPKILFYVSKNNFWPRPKVDGMVIKLKIKSLKLKVNKDLFFKIVKAGFSHPRKQLANNLSRELKLNKEEVKKWLSKNKIDPKTRVETTTIEDWIRLTKNWSKGWYKI